MRRFGFPIAVYLVLFLTAFSLWLSIGKRQGYDFIEGAFFQDLSGSRATHFNVPFLFALLVIPGFVSGLVVGFAESNWKVSLWGTTILFFVNILAGAILLRYGAIFLATFGYLPLFVPPLSLGAGAMVGSVIKRKVYA